MKNIPFVVFEQGFISLIILYFSAADNENEVENILMFWANYG